MVAPDAAADVCYDANALLWAMRYGRDMMQCGYTDDIDAVLEVDERAATAARRTRR